jgi:hypothetical protein
MRHSVWPVPSVIIFFFVPTAKSQQTFWCNKHSCTVQDRSTFFFLYLNPPRIEMFTHITIRSLFPPPFFLLKKKIFIYLKKEIKRICQGGAIL